MQVDARDAYLELLKQSLTRGMFVEGHGARGRRRYAVALMMQQLARRGFIVVPDLPSIEHSAVRRVPGLPGSRLLAWLLARRGFAIVPDSEGTRTRRWAGGRRRLRGWSRRLARTEREFGIGWPAHAETMSGLRRLDNAATCVARVVHNRVPGDLLEAGVWRGGTTILMRAVLAAYDDDVRKVWVADSFQGLPKPDAEAFPADAGLDFTAHENLSVGVQQVRANFARYGLLDDRVEFLAGWFKDTLPNAPVDRLAVLRLDGDLYESTMDALQALYPKLSVGGYCIIDDYGAFSACRRAVDDYRAMHGITDEILPIDWTGAYWQRERE
jgi:O-methyltransferase